MEESKLETEREQKIQLGRSWLTLKETLEKLKTENQIFKKEESEEELKTFEQKNRDLGIEKEKLANEKKKLEETKREMEQSKEMRDEEQELGKTWLTLLRKA